jgi:TatD DNase family protein
MESVAYTQDARAQRRPGAAMIDTHCHLDVAAFDGDRDAVLARADRAGVQVIVVPAIQPSTWERLGTLCRDAGPRVVAAFGAHPQVVPSLGEDEWRALGDGRLAAALAGGAVAVGECGLDKKTGDHPAQERALRLQVAVARELGLPLLVHVLGAHDVAASVLRDAGAAAVGGILHSFSGSAALVPVYRDLGFAFSFAGPVTYRNARRPLDAARAVPADLLLAETDAPDQSPEPYRGRRCEPAYVAEVIAGLAAARGETPAAMAALTTANARRWLALR